jgi:hypothetical protein
MRRLLFLVAISGCASHAASSSPAWPKPSHGEEDGGESIAPRSSRPVAVAIEKSDEEPAAPAVAPTPVPAAATPAKKDVVGTPAVTAPTGAVEETITTEDIVIEIDD